MADQTKRRAIYDYVANRFSESAPELTLMARDQSATTYPAIWITLARDTPFPEEPDAGGDGMRRLQIVISGEVVASGDPNGDGLIEAELDRAVDLIERSIARFPANEEIECEASTLVLLDFAWNDTVAYAVGDGRTGNVLVTANLQYLQQWEG